jgi:hypothetical protein
MLMEMPSHLFILLLLGAMVPALATDTASLLRYTSLINSIGQEPKCHAGDLSCCRYIPSLCDLNDVEVQLY